MCKKLECTRCNYELKGIENYCPICGLDLKERTAQEVLVQEQLVLKHGNTVIEIKRDSITTTVHHKNH